MWFARGHAGRVGVPDQEIEGHRLFALEIIVDVVRPDQVVRPEHVEGLRHGRAFEIAVFDHLFLDLPQLFGVDEDLEIARVGEVDLGGEEGRALDAVVADGGHVGERRREQRSADAVADRGDFTLAGRLFDAIEGGQNALAHIGFEPFVGEALVRVDPGNDEHGQALRDRPADERLLRIEIEDVELVDPGRHDQERALVDLRRRGLVLDELDELVAEDHLAGRVREIDAELEGARVRPGGCAGCPCRPRCPRPSS